MHETPTAIFHHEAIKLLWLLAQHRREYRGGYDLSSVRSIVHAFPVGLGAHGTFLHVLTALLAHLVANQLLESKEGTRYVVPDRVMRMLVHLNAHHKDAAIGVAETATSREKKKST